MEVLNFDRFFKINESIKNRRPNVIENDGEYIINVLDVTKDTSLRVPRKILFSENNGTVNLFYIKKSGKELDSINVPISSVFLKRDSSGNVVSIIFDKYKNQIGISHDSIDDFIEGFRNYLHLKNNKSYLSVEGDIEMILDLIGIEPPIKELSNIKDLKWECKMEDGSFIEIEKRSPLDFFSCFKFYAPEEKYTPSININNKSKTISFLIKKDDSDLIIEEPGGITNILKDNPYYKYLIRRSLKKESDQERNNLTDYFKDFIKTAPSKNGDNTESESIDSINRMKKVLSVFLSKEEIEDISNPR